MLPRACTTPCRIHESLQREQHAGAQTVAVPAGNPRLTFWYQPHCTDARFEVRPDRCDRAPGPALCAVLTSARLGVWQVAQLAAYATSGSPWFTHATGRARFSSRASRWAGMSAGRACRATLSLGCGRSLSWRRTHQIPLVHPQLARRHVPLAHLGDCIFSLLLRSAGAPCFAWLLCGVLVVVGGCPEPWGVVRPGLSGPCGNVRRAGRVVFRLL